MSSVRIVFVGSRAFWFMLGAACGAVVGAAYMTTERKRRSSEASYWLRARAKSVGETSSEVLRDALSGAKDAAGRATTRVRRNEGASAEADKATP